MTHPSMVDYPGRMSVLFFTQGCSFSCGFCHNPDLMPLGGEVKTYSWERLEELCTRYKKQWVNAVTITGGEPTMHQSLGETIDFFYARGFSVKLDTNGSHPDMLRALLPHLSYVAMDIKCGPSKYPEFVRFCQMDRIKESVDLLIGSGVEYEFRTTLMEGVEGIHTDEDILEAAQFIKGAKRWIFQPFLPHDNLPNETFRSLPRTRPATLKHAAEIAAPYVQQAIVR